MDSEKQKDEISALESIYNKDEFTYEEVEGKYECLLKIFIRLPSDYYLTYKDTRAHDEPITKVPISHLPPLILYVSIPPDYPSKSPPTFTLCCSWLRYSMLSKLCKKLDQLWEENNEQEILFTWMASLQNDTLEYLNIQDHLDVCYIYTFYLSTMEKGHKAQIDNESGSTSEKKAALTEDQKSRMRKKIHTKRKLSHRKPLDSRAVIDRLINRNPVQTLVDYNEMQIRVEFKKNFYMCKICFNEKSGEHCTDFTPCNHVFCKECITGYLETRIKDGTVQNISCPEDKCTSEATPGQVKDLVSPELFAKYDSVLLSVTLETMTDIVYCPRKHCQYPVSREPDEVMANCPVCQYAFCIYCKMVYHGIEPCKVNSGEKKKLIAEYQEASNRRKLEMEQRYGKRQLQLLVENAMSENWITSNSHHCPHCNTAIEKSDGCNKMTCGRCNTYFCWICGAQLNRETPYLHYRNPNSECFNMLYHGLIPEEEDEDPEDGFFMGFDSEDEDYFDHDYVLDLDI